METIDKIKQFRKEHKNKAISTSHFYSLDDYKIIFTDLFINDITNIKQKAKHNLKTGIINLCFFQSVLPNLIVTILLFYLL